MSLHYNRSNSYFFVNSTEIHKFKEKDSEIVQNNLCLGNFSKDFWVSNMKKYIYDFSVECNAFDVDDISDIHMYLMKKNDIV